MKKVVAILVENEGINITDLLIKETGNSVFLGHWSEILFNKEECITAISNAVNSFLESSDKQLIVFACHKNDISDIRNKIKECDFSILHY